ncbi:MAG: hypothetical protein KAF91_17475 [Nostoc sp. TH1S01]|nr:hypothetical protein [Nostoc sp. TH1S01]
MNSNNFFHRVKIGIKNKPFHFLVNIFIAYAAIWTILEPLLSIVQNAGKYFSGEIKFFAFVLISSLIGTYKTAVPKSINFRYGNTSIEIIFGDLFSFTGFKVIPVSRYFYEIQVVATSLQNKLIHKFVTSHEGDRGFDVYQETLSKALQYEIYQESYRSVTQQKEKYYPLGTTATLMLNGQDYMLFALTETELKGQIPDDNCNVSKMWIALEKFWKKARIDSRGKSINIPLIGSGVTGIRLNPTQLLELNLLAIANAIEEEGKITTEEIRIVLHPKYIENINLNNIQKIWS